MQYLDTADIREALDGYDESAIDPEFLPYIKRINELQCAISCQCCIGHIPYDEYVPINPSKKSPPSIAIPHITIPHQMRPEGASDHWGYLALFVTEELLECLADRYDHLKETDWIWQEACKLWYYLDDRGDEKYDIFSVTPNDSAFIVFAWDAKYWPQPAEEITDALEICANFLTHCTKQ